MPRPRSSTFYLPLAPLDAPLSLKAKLSVLPPQAANALLAPRARSSTVSCAPCNPATPLAADSADHPQEDECARLERVLGCATRARDGSHRYRAASPELRNDWSSPSPPRSPPRSPNPPSAKEIIHVDMDVDPVPMASTLLPPLPRASTSPLSSPSAFQHATTPLEPEPEMVYQLDESPVAAAVVATDPTSTEDLAASVYSAPTSTSTICIDDHHPVSYPSSPSPPSASTAPTDEHVPEQSEDHVVIPSHEAMVDMDIESVLEPAQALQPLPPTPTPSLLTDAPAPGTDLRTTTPTRIPTPAPIVALPSLPHGWYAVLATRPRVASPLSLVCTTLDLQQLEYVEQVDVARVWGAVDDTPLPRDCRAYFKRDCRVPLPPPPPPCPAASSASSSSMGLPMPAPAAVPTVVVVEQESEGDAEMTPCEPVEIPQIPAAAVVPAPLVRPRYRTAAPLWRKMMRRAMGATNWERNEVLRMARLAESGGLPHPPAAIVAEECSKLEYASALAKLASLGEWKASSAVEFCGGATFWEGEDGEECLSTMSDDGLLFEDTEWEHEGDFEPLEMDGDEWDNEDEDDNDVKDVSVLFDEETEIVRSVGAGWTPPSLSPRPPSPPPAHHHRPRSGRGYPHHHHYQESLQLQIQHPEEGMVERDHHIGEMEEEEEIFRYRPLEDSELAEWQHSSQFPEIPTDVHEEFFDSEAPPPQVQEERAASPIEIESPMELVPQSTVVFKETPASPMVESFPSQEFEHSPIPRPSAPLPLPVESQQQQQPQPREEHHEQPEARPVVLLAPAPKHAWGFSSIRNALTSSVSSLVQIARSRSASPLPWLRSRSASPASLEDMVRVPGTPPVRSQLYQSHSHVQDTREEEACTTPTPSDPRDCDSWSQSSTRTATPGLAETDALTKPASSSDSTVSGLEPLMIVSSTPPKRTLSTSSMSSVASEAESESGSSAASNGESTGANGYSRSPSPEPSIGDKAGHFFQPNWWDGSYSMLAPPMPARKDSYGSHHHGPLGLARSVSPSTMPGSWDPFEMEGWEDGR